MKIVPAGLGSGDRVVVIALRVGNVALREDTDCAVGRGLAELWGPGPHADVGQAGPGEVGTAQGGLVDVDIAEAADHITADEHVFGNFGRL